MLSNLFSIRPLNRNLNKLQLPRQQHREEFNEQEYLSSFCHHDATESIRRFKERYHIDRIAF